MTAMSPYGTYAGGLGALGSIANQQGYSGVGTTANDAGSAFGVLGGLQQGGAGGYGRAAIGGGKIANSFLGNPNLNTSLSDLNNLLSIYQGVQKGGVAGYGGAAANAAQLGGNLLGNSALSTVGGYVAAPLAVYNAARNWQSGKAGSDAASDAAAGAAIGSVVPGIGTAIGAIGGGLVGALSSLVGPGAKDPETANVQNLINAVGKSPSQAGAITSSVQDPYVELAGLMDERSSTLPMYQQYGRMGEQKFTTDMTGEIKNAFTPGQGIESGPLKGDVWSVDPQSGNYTLTTPSGGKTIVPASQAADQVYNSAVAPWVNSMGSGWNNVGQTYKDTTQGLLEDMTGQYISGQAANDWKAVGGDSPFANIYGSASSANTGSAQPPARAQMPVSVSGRQTSTLAAEGGLMKHRKSALSDIYSGNFANRTRHFDEGGYVNYVTPSAGNYELSAPELQDLSSYFDPNNTSSDNFDSDIGMGSIVNAQNDPYAYGINPGGSGGSSGSGSQSALQQLLGSYGKYAALLPLLGALTGVTNPKQASAATPPSGFSSGVAGNFAVPNFNRTQTPINPNTDWYTYGQHPETNFFQNNQLPYVQGVSPQSAAPTSQSPSVTSPTQQTGYQPLQGHVMARGGALGAAFDSKAGDRYVEGPGDGTSDDIPAKLSDGEYVMDAGSVSMLGNGSNKAGAAALDKLRENIRKHAGKQMAKGKQFMKSKPPEAYLSGAGNSP